MFKLQKLYDAINRLRRRKERFYTNCFFLHPRMKFLSEQNNSKIQIGENGIILLYEERDFQRLYYWGSGLSSIFEICHMARGLNEANTLIVADVVGDASYISCIGKEFEKQKARKYAVLSRYRASVLRTVPEKPVHCECALVSQEDVPRILSLLEENLDPLVSHLPTLPYLYELQKRGLLYGCYVCGQLIGVECLESIGLGGRYIYQAVIKKTEQHKGYIMTLKNYIVRCNPQCEHWSVWIDDTNISSVYVHERFGLVKDGLKNMVVVL